MINCISINVNKINREIENYVAHEATTPNYLIMNPDTVMLLDDYYKSSCLFQDKIAKEDGYFGVYHGIPIAVCNKLKMGEVDFV